MGFFSDFKAFLMKGDIIALATAVIIGAAFNKIISSVVADVIMPIIGVLTGGIDFTQKFISLDGNHYETLEAA
jgi:large conductance mechanosensitive channel